jgi:hypothetical protein
MLQIGDIERRPGRAFKAGYAIITLILCYDPKLS